MIYWVCEPQHEVPMNCSRVFGFPEWYLFIVKMSYTANSRDKQPRLLIYHCRSLSNLHSRPILNLVTARYEFEVRMRALVN